MTNNKTETEQAVELAEKHGFRVEEYEPPVLIGRADNFTNILADHRQQVVEELANKAGVMPHAWLEIDVRVCTEAEVREAIAAMQAKLEQAENRTAKPRTVESINLPVVDPKWLEEKRDSLRDEYRTGLDNPPE